MKGLYGCILCISLISSSYAQNYQSRQSGDWDARATWQIDAGGGFVNLDDPSMNAYPTPSDASGTIEIASTHSVNVNVNISVDQCTISNGGTLTINNGIVLTIVDGSDPDFFVEAGGVVNNNGTLDIQSGFGSAAFVQVAGTINNANAIFGDSNSSLEFLSSGQYFHNRNAGAIPYAAWDDASYCVVTGTTSAVPTQLDQNFGNFTWNTPNLSSGNKLLGLTAATSFDGTFLISSTGTTPRLLVLSNSSSVTITVNNLEITGTAWVGATDSGISVTLDVNGNFSYSSANPSGFFFSNTGACVIRLAGSMVFSAGRMSSFNSGGQASLIFDGPLEANQTFDNTGGGSFDGNKDPVITIASFSRLTMIGESYFNGNGPFNLSADATLGVSSEEGLSIGSNGNIRTTVRSYAIGSNIRYVSSGEQNLGTEWGSGGALDGIAVNLAIDNGSVVTNNNVGATNLVGILSLVNGQLNIGGSNTINIQAQFESTSAGFFGGSVNSNLTFSNAGAVGVINFAPGDNVLNNFTISRDQKIVLGTDLAVNGDLSFSNNGRLEISGRTLTIEGNNGDIVASSGGLVSSSSDPGNLVLGGVGALTSVPFSGTGNTLNDLTFNRGGDSPGPSYPWTSSVTILGNVYLTTGVVTNSTGALTMGNGATLHRSAGSLLGSAPAAIGTYNVVYNGSMNTGLELPTASSSDLNDMSVAGTVTLDKSISVNGTLEVNSGSLAAGSNTVTVAGPALTVNAGTFTTSGPVIFSYPGTTTIGGNGINNTQFADLTINNGTIVNAPNATIGVAGTWNNLGTFVPNSGTVLFNGGNQNIDPNGQPFNNVTFASSAASEKSLAGVLVVNGTLTINSGVELNAETSSNTIFVGGGWDNAGTFTPNGNTVVFNGGTQAISEAGSFANLELAGTGTKTLQRALTVNGNLEINGVTFSTGASNYNITLGGDWINNGSFTTPTGAPGTIVFNGTTLIGGSTPTRFRNIEISGDVTGHPVSIEVVGNWNRASGTYSPNGGTVSFLGTGVQSITSGGQSFHHLTISGGNTKALQDNLDVNGNLTLTAGTLNASSRTVTLAGNFSASASASLTSASSTFVFDGAAQNITSSGKSFNNVQVAGTNTKTLLDAFDANGSITITSNLAAGANNILVAGAWDVQSGGFTTTGTTTFDGTDQGIRTRTSSFGNLVLAGSGTKLLHNALDVNGNLTIAATLDVNTSNYALTVGGHWDSSIGAFTARSSSVTLDGTAQNISLGANAFNILALSGSGTKTQLDALDIDNSLTINSGATLSSGEYSINLAGSWTSHGGYNAGTGTVTLDGSGSQSIGGTSPTTFHNLTVNKGAGTATVASAQSITNILTMQGGTLAAAGNLTLVSNATGDARIAPITGGSITGNVVAQRYMHIGTTLPNGGVYRYFASPVLNATVSQLKDDFPVTGVFNDPSTSGEWPGLNVTSSARIMFLYNEAHTPTSTVEDRYEAYPYPGTSSTEAPLENGRGYSARIRQKTPITIDVVGTPAQGPIQVDVTAQSAGGNDGWNMIGNPYAAPINWENVTIPENVLPSITLKDNADNLNVGAGNYAYYVQGSPGLSIPEAYDGTIASGQAFWVRATDNASIIFQEDDKHDVSSPNFIRSKPYSDILRIKVAGNNRQDEAIVGFIENSLDQADASFDSYKWMNDYINLYSFSTDSVRMAVNVFNKLDCNREVGLVLDGVAPGDYSLAFSQLESFSPNVAIRLLDTFSGEVRDVTPGDDIYHFKVTSDKKSFGAGRFRLYFTYPAVETNLGLSATDVCVGSDARISVENTQEGVRYFATVDGQMVSNELNGDGGTLDLTVGGDHLGFGDNVVAVMAAMGGCDPVPLERPVTIKTDSIYSIVSASGFKHCGEGQVVLSASGAPNGGSYRWYEAAESTTPIPDQYGPQFVTPVINKTQTYFVSAVNALGCEGARKQIAAEVVFIEPVSITIDGEMLVSSYASGNQWYFNGEALSGDEGVSQSIAAGETGLYELEVSVNGCSTRTSQEMIILGAEESLHNGFQFFPNPVSEVLQIDLPYVDGTTASVYNSLGQPLGEIKFRISNQRMTGEFNFANESAGLYFVRIHRGKLVVNQKIIKK